MQLISYQLNHQNYHLSAINQTKLDDIWTAHLLTPREGKKVISTKWLKQPLQPAKLLGHEIP